MQYPCPQCQVFSPRILRMQTHYPSLQKNETFLHLNSLLRLLILLPGTLSTLSLLYLIFRPLASSHFVLLYLIRGWFLGSSLKQVIVEELLDAWLSTQMSAFTATCIFDLYIFAHFVVSSWRVKAKWSLRWQWVELDDAVLSMDAPGDILVKIVLIVGQNVPICPKIRVVLILCSKEFKSYFGR